MPKIDTKSLLQGVNLIDLVTSDLGQAVKTSGKYTFFQCPFHAEKSASFAVTSDRYFCFGCRSSGDAIKWLMEYRKLAFLGACEVLSPSTVVNNVSHGTQSNPLDSTATILARQNVGNFQQSCTIVQKARPDDYQGPWMAIIDECQKLLWSDKGKVARAYLHNRGLNDDTLQSQCYRVGYSDGRKIADAWVDRGIVLPCFTVDQKSEVDFIEYIKIRHVDDTMPKYRKLTGGRKGLYGADTIKGASIVIVTEGEFDCMLLNQYAGALVGVCTLGSATDRFDWGRYGKYVGSMKYLLIAYDLDDAGDQGAQAWQAMSGRVKRVRIPENSGKDITDAWKSGVDLSAWVKDEISGM